MINILLIRKLFLGGGGGGGRVFAPQCVNIRPCICISLLQLYPFFIVKLCQRGTQKKNASNYVRSVSIVLSRLLEASVLNLELPQKLSICFTRCRSGS